MDLTKPQKKQLIHALRIAVDYETDYVNSLKIDGKLIRSGENRGETIYTIPKHLRNRAKRTKSYIANWLKLIELLKGEL